MKNKNTIVKQLAGNLLFLGGKKEHIEPLNWAIFNWGATSDDLRDFGDADNFSWFSTTIDGYIRARANAFITNRDKYFKKSKNKDGGLWNEAVKLAKAELESYSEQTFIVYDDRNYTEPYSLGHLQPSLADLNQIEEIYQGVDNKIKLNLDKVEQEVKEE